MRSPGRVDLVGAVLLSAGLVALLLAISEGRGWGWTSAPVLGLFTAGVVLLVAFTAFESRTRQPLIDVALLRRRVILTSNLAALIIGFGMYGAFTLVPLLAQTPPRAGYGFGASVTQAGLFMLPMAVTMLVASPVAGRIGARTGFTFPLVLACVLGALGFAGYAAGHDHEWVLYGSAAVLGVGVGFAFASLANLVVDAVDAAQTGEATGINTIMRTIGGTLGAQIAATVVISTQAPGAPFPAESGFTLTFVMSAAAMVLAAAAALAGAPRRRRAA